RYAGPGCGSRVPTLAGGAVADVPDSRKPGMSCLVTRPLIPVPRICWMSTLCLHAMGRTSGEGFWRRSSSLSGAPVPSVPLASAIDSPIWGITTLVAITALRRRWSTSIIHQSLRRRNYLVHARQKRSFQRRRVRRRGIFGGDADDGRVEILEGLFRDDRRELAADAAGACRLVEHQHAAGLRDRREQRFTIERRERTQVEYLRVDAGRLELRCRIERGVHHRPERHDREVFARAPDLRCPERHDVVLLGHVVFDPAIQEFVLE